MISTAPLGTGERRKRKKKLTRTVHHFSNPHLIADQSYDDEGVPRPVNCFIADPGRCLSLVHGCDSLRGVEEHMLELSGKMSGCERMTEVRGPGFG